MDIIDEVCKDLQARAKLGEKKYGERLRPFNGRNALRDLYEEILDAGNYCKQTLLESREDWAYLAGLIDGEGCICIVEHKKSGYINAALEVCMTDNDPLKWAMDFTGYGSINVKHDKRVNRRTVYQWNVCANDKVVSILEKIIPYLKVKKPEAKAFLILHNLRKSKGEQKFAKRAHPEAEKSVCRLVNRLKARDTKTAYEEALDLANYLKQQLIEDDASKKTKDRRI